MQSFSERGRRGFHPLGALTAAVLGVALGFGALLVPGTAGALLPSRPELAAGVTTPATTPDTAPATAPTTAPPPPPAPTTTVPAPPVTAAPRPAVKRTVATTPPTTSAPRVTAPTASRQQATAVAPAAPSGKYAFLTLDKGRPVRYDPCQPIHYQANLALAPANGLSDLQEAVRRVAEVTGLNFVYDGETTEVPTSHRELHGANALPNGWPPVVVAWTTPNATDLFTSGSVGEGGSTWSGFPGHEVYVTGLIVIDANQNARVSPGFGNHSLGAVLMHELGHVVGLDHVDDPTQLMYPTVTSKPAAFGSGDLAGLRLLGAEGGCFPA